MSFEELFRDKMEKRYPKGQVVSVSNPVIVRMEIIDLIILCLSSVFLISFPCN